MVVEVIVYVGENPGRNFLYSNGLIVEGRTCDWNENEDDIIDKERCEHDERHTFELLVLPDEIVENGECYHRVICRIAHVEEFAENDVRQLFGKEQGWLHAEPVLLPLRKQVVEIGEQTVELISVGIPPCQKPQLRSDAHKTGEPAGKDAIDEPQGCGHGQHTQSSENHCLRILHLCVKEEGEDERKQHVRQHGPLKCHETFERFFLKLKKFFYKFLHS